jgi:hypothetical protein
MEPPHCAEDQRWAEAQLRPGAVKSAYAWRSLRESGARLLATPIWRAPTTIFLRAPLRHHSKGQGPDSAGRLVRRKMSRKRRCGSRHMERGAPGERDRTLAPGKWADITIMDIDPLVVGRPRPGNSSTEDRGNDRGRQSRLRAQVRVGMARLSRRSFLQTAAAAIAPGSQSTTRSAPDVVVVGAGAFGGWTALHLREMGHAVTMVDAYGPERTKRPGGETRQIRGLRRPGGSTPGGC